MARGVWRVGLALLAAACSVGSDGDVSAHDVSHAVSESRLAVSPADPGSSGWILATSGDGARVRINVGAGPLVPGDVRLVIRVDGQSLEPRSIDLASPSMPLHGVVRYDTRSEGEQWIAQVHVPMAGDWSVFVNLGDGLDFAEARFTVGDGQGRTGAHH